MTTGYVWHAVYGWADTSGGGLAPSDPTVGLQPISHHVAHPDTKRRFHELLEVSGLSGHLVRIEPRPATDSELLAIHTSEYVERIKAESSQPKGGDAGDGVSPFGKGGHDIAILSAGGAISLVDAVIDGTVDNGFALVNPPGHHATRETGMGFCIYNNISAAAAHARSRGAERVAIVDWDVHHGNGTQDIWYDRSDVLTVSVHQDRCFPPTSGFRDEQGRGEGFGYSLNIPLPPGSGNGAYLYALDQVVIPALEAYRPDIILVACGFDAATIDPLARQMVTSHGFAQMTRRMLDAAAGLCNGRIAFVQEGGYSPHYVPFCGLAVIREILGLPYQSDPFAPMLEAMGGDQLVPHQRETIDAAAKLVGDVL